MIKSALNMSTESKTSSGHHEGTQIQIGSNLCNACDTGDTAISYCQHCHEYLCAECTKFHKRQTKTKEHDLLDIVLSHKHHNVNRCLQHGDCIAKFCVSCNDIICESCLKGSHNGHKIRDITGCTELVYNLCLDKTKELHDPLNDLQIEQKNISVNEKQFVDKCNSIEDEIQTRKINLITMITKLADGALNKVRTTKNNITSMYTQTAHSVAKVLKECEMVATPVVTGEDTNSIVRRVIYLKANIQSVNEKRSEIKVIDGFKIQLGDDCSSEIEEKAAASLNINVVEGTSKNYNPRLVEVKVMRGIYGFGFTIGGGSDNQHIPSDNGIFVIKIVEGGSMHKDGRVQEGDKIIAIDGVNIENVTHREAVSLLKAAKENIILLVEKQWHMAAGRAAGTDTAKDILPGSTREFLIKKGTLGFGFSIVGGEASYEGIFISAMIKDGPECIGGDLRPGDQLLSVDGIDLQNSSHVQALSVLKRTSNIVRVRVKFMPKELSRIAIKHKAITVRKERQADSKLSGYH